MPLCTLHLLSLHRTTPSPLQTFLSTLKSTNLSPLVISRVIRWIILPTTLSTEHLLARNIAWDILLILPSTDALPPNLAKLIEHHWSVTAGVPSRLTQSFAAKNNKLLHPDIGSIPQLSSASTTKTASSAQNLELSQELNEWIDAFVKNSKGRVGKGAVSMFNLLSFKPGMKAEYLKYGAAFAESIGSKHGGNAKIVGNVTHVNGVAKSTAKSKSTTKEKEEEWDGGSGECGWDEIALAHYPSIEHFRDMLVSREYQSVNKRHRVPSLRDTCILMTSELAVEELVGGGARL
nr:hypothetical protein [Phoma sp.]